jgi:DNA-binding NarL/FixJ family response regulator
MKGETEGQVKACLVEGLSTKEIRERLHLSRSGVNFHIGKMMRERGLWGTADQRRLIVLLVREMFALTGAATPSTVAALHPGEK